MDFEYPDIAVQSQIHMAEELSKIFGVTVHKQQVSEWCTGKRLPRNAPEFPPRHPTTKRWEKPFEAFEWYRQYVYEPAQVRGSVNAERFELEQKRDLTVLQRQTAEAERALNEMALARGDLCKVSEMLTIIESTDRAISAKYDALIEEQLPDTVMKIIADVCQLPDDQKQRIRTMVIESFQSANDGVKIEFENERQKLPLNGNGKH